MKTKDLFLITGGGTGAKVAEALVHLSAAGLGPERIHVLQIDSDTSNGNLSRASLTIKALQKMRRWPWRVRTNQGADPAWLGLFESEVTLYQITEEIKTVFDGGLRSNVPDEMRQVLDLLYDEGEQAAKCDDGFRARPNLGCVLMADHLNLQLPEKALGFVEAIRRAVGDTHAQKVPVVVAASVFGGTGAAILPIIRECVERVLRNKMDKSAVEKLSWAAVKLLPHYQPVEKRDSVDPDRFLLDTASSLQYYSTVYETTGAGRFDAIYIIGSDDPGRNQVETVLGHSKQANPAYFEEFLAGLAALHFAENVDDDAPPIRVFEPAKLGWENMPYASWQRLRENLGYILHLAAFFLRRGTGGDEFQMSQGLGSLLRSISDDDLSKYPWYEELLDPWATTLSSTYRNAASNQRATVIRNHSDLEPHSIQAMLEPAADYFGRLLFWAESALVGDQLQFMDHAPGTYASLYGAMSEIAAQDIDSVGNAGGTASVQAEDDNALARLLRAALAGMVREHQHTAKKRGRNPSFELIDRKDVIAIRTTVQQTKDVLRQFNLGRIAEEYERTVL